MSEPQPYFGPERDIVYSGYCSHCAENKARAERAEAEVKRLREENKKLLYGIINAPQAVIQELNRRAALKPQP